MSLQDRKKKLRAALMQCRSKLPEEKRIKMSQQIVKFLHEMDEFNQAKSVFCYVSYRSEVDTHNLIDHFIAQGLVLAVPKISGNTDMMAVLLSTRAELEPDNMGILTPKSNQIRVAPFDLALTPGLGFTVMGGRLGYGRGYYDRWFSNVQVKTKIGLAFEMQIVDDLPLEETDILLDVLITEERIIDLRSNGLS